MKSVFLGLILTLFSVSSFAADYSGKASGAQVDRMLNSSYDFMLDFSAKCDEVRLWDGQITSGSAALYSPSAVFTSTDVGKYISMPLYGASVSNPATQLTLSVNGGGSGTTWYYAYTAVTPSQNLSIADGESTIGTTSTNVSGSAALNAINSITVTRPALPAGAYAWNLYRSTNGSTWTKIAGPMSVASIIDTGFAAGNANPGANTTHQFYEGQIAGFTDAHHITLSSNAGWTKTGLQFNYGSDDTTPLNNALAGMYSNGMGTTTGPSSLRLVENKICRIQGQILVPTDSGSLGILTVDGAGAEYTQPPMRIFGPNTNMTETSWKAFVMQPYPIGAALDMHYPGQVLDATHCDAKLCSHGVGVLELDHFSIVDFGNDSAPFIHTTFTQDKIHDMLFAGDDGEWAAQNDVLILGGNQAWGASPGRWDSAFQGYGTVLSNNVFDGIKRAAILNGYANGILVYSNLGTMTNANQYGGIIQMNGNLVGGLVLYGELMYNNMWEVKQYRTVYEGYYVQGSKFGPDHIDDMPAGLFVSGAILDSNSNLNYVELPRMYGINAGANFPFLPVTIDGINTTNNEMSMGGSGFYGNLTLNSHKQNYYQRDSLQTIKYNASQVNSATVGGEYGISWQSQFFDGTNNQTLLEILPTTTGSWSSGAANSQLLFEWKPIGAGSLINMQKFDSSGRFALTGSISTGPNTANNGYSAPAITSCGTGSPTAAAGSNHLAGIVTVGGGAPTACTVTFGTSNNATAYTNTPACVVSPVGATSTMYISAQSNTAFTVTFITGITKFNYHCIGQNEQIQTY